MRDLTPDERVTHCAARAPVGSASSRASAGAFVTPLHPGGTRGTCLLGNGPHVFLSDTLFQDSP